MRVRKADLGREGFPEIFVQRLVGVRVFELVSLGQAAGEVHHGLYRHPALYALVAAVELSVSLFYQSHPKLIGVRAAGVAVGAILLR